MKKIIKKIGLLSLSPLNIGGAERNILQIIKHLRNEYKFYILGPISENFTKEAFLYNKSIQIVQLPKFSKFNLLAIFYFVKIFKSLELDLIHTNDPRGKLLAHPAARLLKIKAIHTFHVSPLFYSLNPLQIIFYKNIERIWNNRISTKSIFVSKNVEKMYEDLGLIKSSNGVLVYNGIDLSVFKPFLRNKDEIRKSVRTALNISSSFILACTVGRLEEEKGIDYLIEAVNIIINNREDSNIMNIKFIIVGDGSLKNELENLTKEKGLQKYFYFVGFKSINEVYEIMASCDMFILPSRYECFPYTILEAMAVGLPCIVSNVGGNSELVDNGVTGYVIASGDIQALAKTVTKLVNNKNLRIKFGEDARIKINVFSIESMIKKTWEIYREVLDA